MFISAIENGLKFTRPIQTIVRYWGTQSVEPFTSTLFFVNDQGWALTAGHVGQTLVNADKIVADYRAFKAVRSQLTGGKGNRKAARLLEEKHGYKEGAIIDIRNLFVNCVDTLAEFQVRAHSKYDLALVKLGGFGKVTCDGYPIFVKDATEIKQGKFVCRLGYPFPEFENFEYDSGADEIKWTTKGRQAIPAFPIEGMITRFLADEEGARFGIELSTPGLLGHSGGPAFGVDGRILGLQYATKHLDLRFDINTKVIRNGVARPIKESAFLHVGHCIHVDELKAFMRQENVSFTEG